MCVLIFRTMGKGYKRKTDRGGYGEDALVRAVDELKRGKSFHCVAREFNIPRRTLQRHFKGQVIEPGHQNLGRFRVTLPQEFEDELVSYALDLQKRFYGLTPKELCHLAYDLAVREKIKHQFSDVKERAGRKWLNGFLSRHPELSVRQPEPTSMSRAVGFNKPQVQRFFELVRSEFEKHAIVSSDQIYNMDESGLTAVHRPGPVIAKKGQKQVGRITSGERGKTVTIICTMNASGSYVPPLMIFPRKNMSNLLIKDGPPGTVGAASISGWTDSGIFLQWLNHFKQFAKPNAQHHIVLFLDGHTSHKTLEAIDFCRNNDISLISFPPHTTHRLQPLDRCFFGPLKTFYNSACDVWMTAHSGQRIGFYDIAGLFKSAYFKAATMDKGINGFQACGLFPLNPDIFGDEEYLPSMVTEEVMPTTSNAVTPSSTTAASDQG